MATEKEVQEFVHTLEEGVWARWLRVAMVIVALVTLTFIVLTKFRGLSVPEGMEQAEIGREIARGNGFSTKMIRPMALWQLKEFTGKYPTGNIPDTFHAPLNPWVNSWFLRLIRDQWVMTPQMIVAQGDYTIAQVAIGFFMLSIWINYFTAKRLFDRRLALIGMGLAALCNSFWQFALSGLPQMLMLFLFSATVYVLVRALEARSSGGRIAPWVAIAGALFGLLALAHGLTIWIFLGAFAYTAVAFQPRARHALLMLGVFVLVYTPWLVRNYLVCGDARGLAAYAGLDMIVHSGSEWMRTMKPSMGEVFPILFLDKLLAQVFSQFDRMYGLLGASVVAPLFFVSLFHPFKRASIASFRWCFLAMGLGALLGMGLFGVGNGTGNCFDGPWQPNNLYVLFVPIMIYYGLAFFLALWTRLENGYDWMRIGLLALIYVLSAAPLVNELRLRQGAFNWKPYVPPVISVFNLWTTDDEIMMSDMPWAVSWYADRRCLWMPGTINDFVDLSDYNRLGAPIVALYLTPVSGDARLREDVVYGEYRGWSRLILGLDPAKDFPFQFRQVLPVHDECIVFADRPRWLKKKKIANSPLESGTTGKESVPGALKVTGTGTGSGL